MGDIGEFRGWGCRSWGNVGPVVVAVVWYVRPHNTRCGLHIWCVRDEASTRYPEQSMWVAGLGVGGGGGRKGGHWEGTNRGWKGGTGKGLMKRRR